MIVGSRKTLLLITILCISFWPLSMLIIGIQYMNECPGQPQLCIYHILFGSLWLSLSLLNIIRYYFVNRLMNIIFVIIWSLLFVLIIPGYIFLFSLRNMIRIFDSYPNEICEKMFYIYSCISIILVHIPLYIFLLISLLLIDKKPT